MSELTQRVTGFSAQGITRLKSKSVIQAEFLSVGSGGEIQFDVILVIDRSQFLMVIELKSLLAGSLSAGSHSAGRSYLHSLINSSLYFEANSSVSQNFRLLWPAGGKKETSKKPTLLFKGLYYCIRLILIISLSLSQLCHIT